ncbi:MAG: hypothetical protein AB6733_04110 [Clostridiaceae bacterium]
MEEKVIFIAEEKMGVLKEKSISFLNSQYLKNYNKNRMEIKDKHAWKTSGDGARFMGKHNPLGHFDPDDTRVRLNGAAFIKGTEKIIYSIIVNNMSGLFIKDTTDDSETEGHIIHNNSVQFFNIDYKKDGEKIVASINEDGIEKNIAILDIKNPHYSTITEGASMDENPVWSKINNDVIYYDSCGIGRDGSGMIGYSHKVICRLDMNTCDLDEIVALEKYDCFKPKEDFQGNIYFLKKPYKEKSKKKVSIIDYLLIPFRFLKAIFSFMNFFTMKYTGQGLTSGGQNPAKVKEKSPEEIFIEGNLINVANTLKENSSSGEKFPGIAPRSWELMKVDDAGQIKLIKKGVIDFDINSKDEIVYSNGKYLIKIAEDGSEETLGKVDLSTKIRVN